jgi:hypothetical protein
MTHFDKKKNFTPYLGLNQLIGKLQMEFSMGDAFFSQVIF